MKHFALASPCFQDSSLVLPHQPEVLLCTYINLQVPALPYNPRPFVNYSPVLCVNVTYFLKQLLICSSNPKWQKASLQRDAHSRANRGVVLGRIMKPYEDSVGKVLQQIVYWGEE